MSKKTDWPAVHCDIFAGLDLRREFTVLGVEIVGAEPNVEGWVPARAVDRTDNDPSAAVNLTTGRYKDHGGGGLSLNIFDLAATVGKFSDWKEARQHYADAAGVQLPKGRPPADPAAKLDFQPWNERMVGMWCLTKPPITPEAVQAFGGRFAYYYHNLPVVALPVFGLAGIDADPVGWIVWHCMADELPIFGRDGQITGHKKMKTTAGSQAGLIGLHALHNTAADSGIDPASQTVWKVEGPCDALALWTAIPPELRDVHLVVSNAGGAGEHPKPWMAAPFVGRRGVLAHDADEPGEAGARDKWLPWMAGVCTQARQVLLPYDIQPNHGKDIRDFFNEGHTFADLLALVETAEPAQVASVDRGPRAVEADDDPHRLARLFLNQNGHHSCDGYIWRTWNDEFWRWTKIYRIFKDSETKGLLTQSIKKEFDRINFEQQETTKGDELPEAKKVTRPLLSNVAGALQSIVLVSQPHVQRDEWIAVINKEKESEVSDE